jgi:hypothetical protein
VTHFERERDEQEDEGEQHAIAFWKIESVKSEMEVMHVRLPKEDATIDRIHKVKRRHRQKNKQCELATDLLESGQECKSGRRTDKSRSKQRSHKKGCDDMRERKR